MYACMHRAVVTRSPREYINHVCCALGQHTANRQRKCTKQSRERGREGQEREGEMGREGTVGKGGPHRSG